ncbi:MAG: histidine phosphatase family protein [Syntrophobacteraceae bacterium]|nr:histidine phosphatase family protein [Desulfobacteraceae bacterium]
MTEFYLIRHGRTDMVGKVLCGRTPGIRLNADGQRQAQELAGRLMHLEIDHIFSSPLERALETAAPLAAQMGLTVHLAEELTEFDAGEWVGRTFAELEQMSGWMQFNRFRSGKRIPGGESMREVQDRMVALVEKLSGDYPGGRIAIVSHADPIKALLGYYGGIPLDLLLRIEISTASLSVLLLDEWNSRIVCINNTNEVLFPR